MTMPDTVTPPAGGHLEDDDTAGERPARPKVPVYKDPLFVAGALVTVGLVFLLAGRRGCADCARQRKIAEQLGPAAAAPAPAGANVAGPGSHWPRPANAPEPEQAPAPSPAVDDAPNVGAAVDPHHFVIVEPGDGVEQLARVNGAADLGEALSHVPVTVAPD